MSNIQSIQLTYTKLLNKCSQHVFLCYRKPDGIIRVSWRHQPSTLVSIRSYRDPQNEIIFYHNLSEMGIADAVRHGQLHQYHFPMTING